MVFPRIVFSGGLFLAICMPTRALLTLQYPSTQGVKSREQGISLNAHKLASKVADDEGESLDADDQPAISNSARRKLLATSFSWFIASENIFTAPAYAEENCMETSSQLDCLSDLPPLRPDCVRVFLCRHGQTENNRLHLIQGARADPDLNDFGKLQAQSLGQALQRSSRPGPSLFLHSDLKRAKQTATIAASQFTNPSHIPVQMESLLSEVDFGEVAEGQPVEYYRGSMAAAYADWSIGRLDAKMAGGGETGYEVRPNASLLMCVPES